MLYSLIASLLVAPSLALPATVPNTHSFVVKQVPAGKTFVSGPQQLAKTYGKYAHVGAVAPADVKAAAAAVQQGSVAANPEQYDSEYLCPVTVGGQTLNLDFDTGSSDLWVFSTETPASQSAGHPKYNPSTSGKKISGATWEISYQDGSGASGDVYADKVVVGPVTATSQAVEAATQVSAQFTQDTDNDGLLGLAFSSINTVRPTKQTTFFDTVKSSLKQKLFAVDLKKGEAGSYDFGFIDSSKYTGAITYVPVNSGQGFWQFSAGGYSVGSATTTTGSIGTAIADTGTTLLLIPNAAVKAYYAKVSGASYSSSEGGYVFPCSANLPNFNVAIGGKTFVIPGSYINFAPTSGSTCYGGIQSNDGIGLSIFGDIFLKSVYAIFDQTQTSPRLGFAAQS